MILGVMVWPVRKAGSSSYRFMATAAEGCGMKCIFFGPEGVSSSTGWVRGYAYRRGSSHLEPVVCRRVPQVIYNQVRSRIVEESSVYKQAVACFVEHHVPVFNPSFIAKHTVMRFLSADKALQPYVPETIALKRSYLPMLAMLERHKCVFVKPINGSLGKGIMKATRVGPDAYSLVCRGESGQRGYGTMSSRVLVATVCRLAEGRTHVVQQGIDLTGPKGGPTDFRVLVQKDGEGKWQHTFTFAKVARKGSIVSNVAAGAAMRNADHVLAQMVPDPKGTKELMHLVAIQAAECVEECMGLFGELGVDIGVDPAGHPWILEANSRYSRKVFSLRITEESSRRPVMYAHYLVTSGKGPSGGAD